MGAVYQKRFYRDWFKSIDLVFFDVCELETDLRIGASRNLYNEALNSVKKYRKQLEGYIKENTRFLKSLEPIEVEGDVPVIIKRMVETSAKAGVGPMAAVAGAIAEMVGMELLQYSDEVIVENGGDIFIKTNVPRKVGIYAGNSPLSGKIAIKIYPEETPAGICTSSGTVGHSLSFGKADAVVVVSRDAFLADAVATAVGNRVKNPSGIKDAVDFAAGIDSVEGVLVIIGDKLGAWGKIELVGM
ncbi:MAG: UPF0280 family protein [Clostridiaceae bacterium]|nr:UPF0280 family protein [Clostridiaceae bacterium]